MPIISLMRITTDFSSFCSRRSVPSWLAMVVLALGLLAAPARAADSAKNTQAALTPTASSATPAPEKHSDNAGSAFCNGIRLEDEIELVNTRSICGGGKSEMMRNGLKVETYANCDDAGHRRWRSSDLDSFLSFDPSVPTIIFVHGNQITPGDAKDEGIMTYRTIIKHGPDAPRIRFVIFSWPSSKVGGLLYDVREKAARTEPAGWRSPCHRAARPRSTARPAAGTGRCPPRPRAVRARPASSRAPRRCRSCRHKAART